METFKKRRKNQIVNTSRDEFIRKNCDCTTPLDYALANHVLLVNEERKEYLRGEEIREVVYRLLENESMWESIYECVCDEIEEILSYRKDDE